MKWKTNPKDPVESAARDLINWLWDISYREVPIQCILHVAAPLRDALRMKDRARDYDALFDVPDRSPETGETFGDFLEAERRVAAALAEKAERNADDLELLAGDFGRRVAANLAEKAERKAEDMLRTVFGLDPAKPGEDHSIVFSFALKPDRDAFEALFQALDPVPAGATPIGWRRDVLARAHRFIFYNWPGGGRAAQNLDETWDGVTPTVFEHARTFRVAWIRYEEVPDPVPAGAMPVVQGAKARNCWPATTFERYEERYDLPGGQVTAALRGGSEHRPLGALRFALREQAARN